jgi:hypothetical protein
MKLVIVCSPYQGNILDNTEKAKEYCKYVYRQGHTPFAPHLFFPRFLKENNSDEREAGIKLGIEVLKRADELWVFGATVTEGMRQEIEAAKELSKTIKYFKEEEQDNGQTKITFSGFRRP